MAQERDFRLREVREATGKTQKQVADELRLSKSAYNSWETGQHEMRTSQLTVVAEYYGCTPNDILGYPNAEGRFALLSAEEDTLLSLFRASKCDVQESVITLLRAAAGGR